MNRLSVAENELVISVLSASFLENKSVLYTIQKGKDKEECIKGLMKYAYHEGIKQDGIIISDNRKGVALFTYPQRKTTFSIHSLLESVKVVCNVFGVEGIIKVLRREKYIKSLHPQSDYLYLWFIGVLPEMQGKGVGSLLLKEVINIAEEQDIPVYLETSTLENLPFIKTMGCTFIMNGLMNDLEFYFIF